MSNAYPIFIDDYYGNIKSKETHQGLSKREKFAETALLGLIKNPTLSTKFRDANAGFYAGNKIKALCMDAIEIADALIKELEEKNNETT